MSLLDTIKDQVAREHHMRYSDWNDLCECEVTEDVPVDEVARRYAQAVAEDSLKRAADSLDMEIIEGVIYVDKQSILSTEINLDLQ